jgi:hypothetical protein
MTVHRRLVAIAMLCSAIVACGKPTAPSPPPAPEPPATTPAPTPPPPTPSPDPPPTGQPITGKERLGWDQPAANVSELSSLNFAIYVDGTRSVLPGVSCTASAGFACSAQLPALSPGNHTLEVAAFVLDDGAPLESARSPAIRVTVTPGLRPTTRIIRRG